MGMRQSSELTAVFTYLLAGNQPQMAGFKSGSSAGHVVSFGKPGGGEEAQTTPHEGLDLCCFERAAAALSSC
jgi:hypothetical protein